MLEEAYRITGTVVEGISRTDLANPTPCNRWTVANVLNHLVEVIEKFTSFADGTTDRPRTPGSNQLRPDHIRAYRQAVAASSAAWQAYGWPPRQLCWLPFGSYPARTIVGVICFDTLVHGWDLAVATGRPIARDPEPWSFALAAATAVVPDRGRDDRHYREPITPEGRPSPDIALLAYLGRTI